MAARIVKSAQEILGLREDQWTEFKAAESLDNPERLLRVIAAFLNTDGGDLFLGVEESSGIATAIPGVSDPEPGIQRLMDLIADRVEPRPTRLPERTDLQTPEGRVVVQLRVESGSKPPYGLRVNSMYQFPRRVGDRNRPLSWTEVLGEVREETSEESYTAEVRKDLLERRAQFLRERTESPTLRLTLVPTQSLGIDLRSKKDEVLKALQDVLVAGNRMAGWTYEVGGRAQRRQGRWEQGSSDPPYRHLVVKDDGTIIFTTSYGSEWAWHSKGEEDSPTRVLDPYVAVEYPASVIRLAGHLYDRIDLQSPVCLDLILRDLYGVRLGPGHPTSHSFRFRRKWQAYPEKDLLIAPTGPVVVEATELRASPDLVAYRLVNELYEAFGFSDADLPFFHKTSGRFVFP